MATTTLSISVSVTSLIDKIHLNLAIIGKRAKNTKGEALFTDLTTSTLEDPIFSDLLDFGAQNLVAELSDVTTAYVETTASTATISFNIIGTRWNVETGTQIKQNLSGATTETVITEPDLTNALKALVSNYLYNFCLARYLSAIHPQLGEKYPPLFGQTYTDACAVIIQNIKTLAFLKRPYKGNSSISYEDVK